MTKVVNEPQAEYKTESWIVEPSIRNADYLINQIENNLIVRYAYSGTTSSILSKPKKRKLSALRGRLSKQSETEIDIQIKELRNEWNRSI